MEVHHIIAGIDEQIAKLTEARSVLQGISTPRPEVAKKPGRGRPKGSKNASAAAKEEGEPNTAGKSKRKLSPEGRKRIAEAMKRRWAERKKTEA